MSAGVVVVGDVGLDVVVRPSMPLVVGGDTPSQISRTPGGAGANSATWLAAYGVPVALLGRVGADAAGREAYALLKKDGVCPVLAWDDRRPTCTVVVVVADADGERTMLSDRGASGALLTEDMNLDAATVALGEEPRHLHVSGFVLLSEQTRAAGVAALQAASRRNWSTSVDPQAANLVAQMGGSSFLELVEGVDLLLPNAAELEALGGEAAALRAAGDVMVSEGAGGAAWIGAGGRWHVDAPEVTCVETTGCGDAFNAGLLAAWLEGQSPEDALRQGVEAGSRCATVVGARPVKGQTTNS
jgi:sugar/nucleoside kinase (ribokinase family)